MKKIGRRLLSFSLTVAICFSAPGLRSYQAFAENVESTSFGSASPGVLAPQGVSSPQFYLNPSLNGFNASLQSASEIDSVPKIESAIPIVSPQIASEAGVSLAPSKSHLVFSDSKARNDSGIVKIGETIKTLQKNLGPEMAKLKNPSTLSGSSFSLGQRIWNLVSGRGNAAKADVLAYGIAPEEGAVTAVSKNLLSAQEQGKGAEAQSLFNIPSPQNTEAILADVRAHPAAAVFFDYDMTLTDLDARGMSLPIADDVLEGLKKLLRAGWPVGIVSGRSFDREPAKAMFPNTIWEPLIEKIPKSLRKNLFFVGALGSEFIAFKNGEPVRYLDRDWSDAEKEKISETVSDALAELRIPPEAVDIDLGNQAHTVIWFHEKNDPRLDSLAELLGRRLKERGLPYPVLGGGKSIYFSKFDKGSGVSLIYSLMRDRGFPVAENNILFLGDQFHMFPNGMMGGDAHMALAFPKSRAISVGENLSGTLPANVAWLGGPHARGTIQVINELLKLSPPKPAGSFRKKMGLFVGAAFAGTLGFLAAQTFGLIPAAWFLILGPLDFIGTIGVLLLRFSSVPQLFDNFRLGRSATSDLSIKSTLLWFAASVLLSLVSVLNHKNPIWIASNITGVAQGALMLSQILFYNRKGFGKTIATVAVAGLLVPLVLAGVGFSSAMWISILFSAAMGLILTINIPQIAANYQLYKLEHRAPRINPLFPALLMSGSLLSLLPSIGDGNIYWTLTNFVPIIMSLLVLGQIYAPSRINDVIGKALNTLKKALRFFVDMPKWK